ncbi:hypothetical protein GCM10022222_59430 [Amycolatopsis ultiminotia]|uniref:DUF3040 domain-containing protein n=1 Tax=Amycolatopsis ultiminotia TaxID=543629 RepID=A0ABP6XIU3_9PSEU
MALPDDEQRRLDEIERFLIKENPGLAQRFDAPPPGIGSMLVNAAGMVLLLGTGLVITSVGIQRGAPLVIAVGAVLTAVVPGVIGWYLRQHGWPSRKKRR